MLSRLYVKDEFLLQFYEDEISDDQGDQCHSSADDETLKRRGRSIEHYLSEEAYIMVHGIELYYRHETLGKDIYGIEDGGKVHPGGCQNTPKMHYVSEENRKGGKKEPQTQAEEEDEKHQNG